MNVTFKTSVTKRDNVSLFAPDRKRATAKFWTQNDLELLIELHNAGYKAKEIGSQLSTFRSGAAVQMMITKLYKEAELQGKKLKMQEKRSSSKPKRR